MQTQPSHVQPALSWRFPSTFWFANIAELFERAAFYCMFIMLSLYLTDVVKFTDVEAGYVSACFSAILYLLPPFMGAVADRIGFRTAIIFAFALLTAGYGLLGAVPTKPTTLFSLGLIMLGGAIVKPVITGTAAKCSDDRHRARAFSIFYWTVNIGSFSGKTLAAPMRQHYGLEYVEYCAAGLALIALIWVIFFYRDVERGNGKSASDLLSGLLKVILNFRFMVLILIVAGFWLIQGQMYATMPKYVLRLVGAGAKPEWLANVNPFVVVLCVVPITHLIRNLRPENGIGIGLFIIPLSALTMALGQWLGTVTGNSVSVFGLLSLHPLTLMMVLGIALQGFAECFLSPKFLEYASKQAPPGQEGVYMGYQHLTNFFAWGAGFALSGHLFDAFCPDPKKLTPDAFGAWETALKSGGVMPAEYANAHYIWFVYAGIGVVAFLALCIFRMVTNWLDRRLTTPTATPRLGR